MSGVKALERVKPTEPAEPEYQARYVGKAKYAIVLSGESDTVVGWGYDAESAIKDRSGAEPSGKPVNRRAGHKDHQRA
jgi:hypothetical protein